MEEVKLMILIILETGVFVPLVSWSKINLGQDLKLRGLSKASQAGLKV